MINKIKLNKTEEGTKTYKNETQGMNDKNTNPN